MKSSHTTYFFTYFTLLLLISNQFAFATNFPPINPAPPFLFHLADTTPITPDDVLGINNKVTIGSSANAFDITPLSSFNNGTLIEPINRTTLKGISTAFYIRDSTANWSFYTNNKTRLTIGGNGNITTGAGSHLLINNAMPDADIALRVNGNIRGDSSLFIQGPNDQNSFISLHRNVNTSGTDIMDSTTVFTTTPTAWAVGHNIPALRIRHPNNVTGIEINNQSIQRDFLILPYQYGMAIEYNGVVECWVGEWSVHRGHYYYDIEGKGNGWGGVLWVGDDNDAGGVRVTGRNNTELGGNVAYGELSVEKFGGSPNGDLRWRLPSTQNQFQFVYGERGSSNIVAQLNHQGLVLPIVPTLDSIQQAKTAQIVFDSTSQQFKGYDGGKWVTMHDPMKVGTFNASGDGIANVYLIPHGLGAIPSYYSITPTSTHAGKYSHVSITSSHILVYFESAPPAGSNNLSWNWMIKQ
ncbi:MAG: hypothetical protein RLY16_275 [Bacteroidota bacterium]|jgi:hypothetical protein